MAADLLAMQLPLAGLFWHKLRGIKGHIGNGPQADEVLFKELLQLTEQLTPGIDAVDPEHHREAIHATRTAWASARRSTGQQMESTRASSPGNPAHSRYR